MCSNRLAVVIDVSESGTESFHGQEKEWDSVALTCIYPYAHMCIHMAYNSSLYTCLCIHTHTHLCTPYMHWLLLGNAGMTRGYFMSWNHA